MKILEIPLVFDWYSWNVTSAHRDPDVESWLICRAAGKLLSDGVLAVPAFDDVAVLEVWDSPGDGRHEVVLVGDAHLPHAQIDGVDFEWTPRRLTNARYLAKGTPLAGKSCPIYVRLVRSKARGKSR